MNKMKLGIVVATLGIIGGAAWIAPSTTAHADTTSTANARRLFTYGGGATDDDHGQITAASVRGFLGDTPGAEMIVTSVEGGITYTCTATFQDQASAVAAMQLLQSMPGGSFGCGGELVTANKTRKTVATSNWMIKL